MSIPEVTEASQLADQSIGDAWFGVHRCRSPYADHAIADVFGDFDGCTGLVFVALGDVLIGWADDFFIEGMACEALIRFGNLWIGRSGQAGHTERAE